MGVPIKIRFASLLYSLATHFVEKKDGSILRDGSLIRISANSVSASSAFVKGVASKDVTLDGSTGVSIRIYLPDPDSSAPLYPSQSRLPVVVYFHGGGFVFMNNAEKMYDDFCRRLAQTLGAVIVSVDYRLAPEHPYPSAYEDALAVIRWLHRSGNSEPWLRDHTDLRRCFLAGDSAGANIVHHTVLSCCESGFPDLSISGQVLICPFFGGKDTLPSEVRLAKGMITNQRQCDWLWSKFLPRGADKDHPAVNPLGPGRGNLGSLPPSLVLVAELDYLHDRGVVYAEALEAEGVAVELVNYPNRVHGFPILGWEAAKAVQDIRAFIVKIDKAQ